MSHCEECCEPKAGKVCQCGHVDWNLHDKGVLFDYEDDDDDCGAIRAALYATVIVVIVGAATIIAVELWRGL